MVIYEINGIRIEAKVLDPGYSIQLIKVDGLRTNRCICRGDTMMVKRYNREPHARRRHFTFEQLHAAMSVVKS